VHRLLTPSACPPAPPARACSCDKITISPSLLAELEASTEHLAKHLWPSMGGCSERQHHDFDSALFDKLHGSDEMAVEKLAQGIQGFAADQDKLELQLAKLANLV
jgi:transaldolase